MKLLLSLKGNFLTNSGRHHSENPKEVGEFHRSPMLAEVRYIFPQRREGGTLEKVSEEIPNAAKAPTPQRIFTQTNPLTQTRAYEGDISFNGGSRGIMQPI